jgi:predicted aldo/keto reductase-like oxidoreductase
MIYKAFKDLRLSWLGMGNMRLPVAGERGPIDEKLANEIIEYAYANGVNYYDTAYMYHGGHSEEFIGKALSRYPRDSFYLATKMPGHIMRRAGDAMEVGGMMIAKKTISGPADVFEEQLEKCGVDYFDFYLLHNLSESSYNLYADDELGIIEYVLAQKKAGRIRHLGFSAHAAAATINKFLNKYDCFEFVQIQLNYMDWTLQDAKTKYEVITKHGLPVVVMEPCRGGKLAAPGEAASAILKQARPGDSPAAWAFRFIQSLPDVTVALSGMTTLEQLKENVALFSKDDPLTEEDKTVLQKAIEAMASIVPCTSCRYCCDGCPQKLDIPKLIGLSNEASFSLSWQVTNALGAMSEAEKPSACVSCGECSKICPQGIDIPGVLQKFAQRLGGAAS